MIQMSAADPANDSYYRKVVTDYQNPFRLTMALDDLIQAVPRALCDIGEPLPPGTVVAAGPEGIDVACAPGVLRILTLKPAGGRGMDAKTFLNEHRIVAGDRLV